MVYKFPVIDLSKIASNRQGETTEDEWSELARDFNVLKADGFAYLINHGIPMDKVASLFSESKKFFELPPEGKEDYKKSKQLFNFQGYAANGLEMPTKKHEMRELFDVWGEGTKYPDKEVPGFKPAMMNLQDEFKDLAKKILQAISLSLGLEKDFFVNYHKRLDKSFITYRSLYYPKIPDDYEIPKGGIRCREHTDYGTITLIFQDAIGGLQVRTKEGVWEDADPVPGSIVINTCDLLELWTAGHIPACVHRVPIPEGESKERKNVARQSISYFVYPDLDTTVKPIMSVADQKYSLLPSVKASEYYQSPWTYDFSFSAIEKKSETAY